MIKHNQLNMNFPWKWIFRGRERHKKRIMGSRRKRGIKWMEIHMLLYELRCGQSSSYFKIQQIHRYIWSRST